MNDYPFEAEDMIIKILEENQKQIEENRYPASESMTILLENDIPLSEAVLDLIEDWLSTQGILYNPINFGRE